MEGLFDGLVTLAYIGTKDDGAKLYLALSEEDIEDMTVNDSIGG